MSYDVPQMGVTTSILFYYVNVYLDGQKGPYMLHYIASFHYSHTSHTASDGPALEKKWYFFSFANELQGRVPGSTITIYTHQIVQYLDMELQRCHYTAFPLPSMPQRLQCAQSLATSLCTSYTSVTVGIRPLPGYFMKVQTVSPMPRFGGGGPGDETMCTTPNHM